MIEAKTNPLERIRYWQGQLLTADDLETQIRVDLELRRQHDRSAHHAYGIATGLGLTKETEPLIKDGVVTVACGGLAYDCAGHALKVGDLKKRLPEDVNGGETLVLAYDPGNVGGVTVNWKPASEVDPRTDVAILRLVKTLAGPAIDPAFRPIVARPMARPRLATGVTIPGQTEWQSWIVDGNEVGVKVTVDTSAAGFTEFIPQDAPPDFPKVRAPHYFAEVIASRLNNDPKFDPTKEFVPAWFASIAEPSNQGFTLQLMLRQITRENLDISSPRRMAMQAPELNQPITLAADPDNEFTVHDQATRILPLAEEAAVITNINNSSKVITLDAELESGALPRMIAFGNAPRITKVTNVAEPKDFFEVEVDDASKFAGAQVVLKLGNAAVNSPPARIAAFDEDSGVLTLVTAIPGLVAGNELGLVRLQSGVVKVDGTKINVSDPTGFSKDDVVVHLGDDLENFLPAKITDKAADGTLTLSSAIGLAAGMSLGRAEAGSNVVEVDDNETEVTVDVVDATIFRPFDIVAKQLGPGVFSVPVRIDNLNKSKNQLFLNSTIPGLSKGDTIVAANFTSRGTVLSGTQNSLQVVDASPFPKDAKIVSINELLAASLPVSVTASDISSRTLTLSSAIPKVGAGSVIGLCTFPASVEVKELLNDGGIVVSDANLLKQGDLVTALPDHAGLAIVTEANGNVIRLSRTISNLAAGNHLGVVAMGGAVTASAISAKKVTVDLPRRPRVGDFLAEIKGWSQAELRAATTAFVTTVSGNNISLTNTIDGLLLHDLIGLANLNPKFPMIRLKTAHDIQNGDEALLVGLDRKHGITISASVSLLVAIKPENLYFLLPLAPVPGDSILRPEDISLGLLFVRGPALALIKDFDLYVSWLAVGAADAMPRSCPEPARPKPECTPAEE